MDRILFFEVPGHVGSGGNLTADSATDDALYGMRLLQDYSKTKQSPSILSFQQKQKTLLL